MSYPVNFFQGMSATQARSHHLLKYNFEEDGSMLADKRLNPSLKVVHHLRKKWVTQEHGGVKDFSSVDAILNARDKRPRDKIACEKTEHGFVAVLVTEFMLRVHEQLPSASEVVFCDTNSHVTNCTLSMLICDSPAGGMPLGVIITSSHAKQDYLRGELTQTNLS